jgi:hypothetical protein
MRWPAVMLWACLVLACTAPATTAPPADPRIAVQRISLGGHGREGATHPGALPQQRGSATRTEESRSAGDAADARASDQPAESDGPLRDQGCFRGRPRFRGLS